MVLGEIDLVHALGLAGARVAVAASPGDPARYSSKAEAVLDGISPVREPVEAVDRLLGFARSQPVPPVLYYDGDWDLLLISRHRARLREGYAFVVPEPELVEDLTDKERFQALAERLHLPVPAGRRVSAGQWPEDLGLRYPLVVKPLTRDHATWRPLARGKAIHVESPDDLVALRAAVEGTALDLLLQESVPGPESRIESYHVYVDDSGGIAGEFTGRKLRTFPSSYGYSTALITTDSPEVRSVGRDLVGRIGLRGVAKLDFKRNPEGQLLLLEVNSRFNLWHHLGARAGVNIPALVHADLSGTPRPPVPTAARPGVRWCSLAHDLQAARLEGVGSLRWVRWALRCEVKSGFRWDDPLPLPRAAISRLRRR